jgi:hypothetical protein
MKKFGVEVSYFVVEYYEVEAENEVDAEERYSEGKKVEEKRYDYQVDDVYEISPFGGLEVR